MMMVMMTMMNTKREMSSGGLETGIQTRSSEVKKVGMKQRGDEGSEVAPMF